ncbi:MAG: DUF402 domain-containing protein [Bacillota bacterium]
MKQLLVQEYKYNGAKHYSYPARLLSRTEGLVILYGPYNRLLNHPGRNLVDRPISNHTIEFHYLDRPYNITAGFNADGSFYRYYCNITTPATLEEDRLTSVDLDLDLVVEADHSWWIEDEEEFEEHRTAWGYPPELVAMAREGLNELIRLVESRSFPFDGTAWSLLRAQPESPFKR